MRKILVSSLMLLVIGCESTDNHPANYVSPLEFKNYNCKQIAKEMALTSSQIDTAEQPDPTGQVLGAAITAFAISRGHGVKFGHDQETERLKSKYEALHQASIEKNCD